MALRTCSPHRSWRPSERVVCDFTVMDGVVTVYDAGRTIKITNVDPQRSLAIANSFIEVSAS